MDLSLPSRSMQKLRPKFKQTEVWDCPQTFFVASSYWAGGGGGGGGGGGMYGYWQH